MTEFEEVSAKLESNTKEMKFKEEQSDDDLDSFENELKIVKEEDGDYEGSLRIGLNDPNSNHPPIKMEILPSSSKSEISSQIKSEINEDEEFVFATVQDEIHPSHLGEDFTYYLPHPSLRRNLIPGTKIIDKIRKPRSKISAEEAERRFQRRKNTLDDSGHRKYKCAHCSFKADNISSLKRHSASHTNEKPFVCAICGHRCNQKANLTTHMITHTDLKPFKCRVCNFRSKLKGNIKKHEIKYH